MTKKTFAAQNIESYFLLSKKRHTHTPVSYTHLDVYKRQTQVCAFRQAKLLWPYL